MISRVLKGRETIMTQPFHYKGEWKDGQYYNYYHGGVDLVGCNYAWTPPNCLDWIIAHSDGVVIDLRTNCTGYEEGSYGNYVLLLHKNGYYTMYAHLAYGYVNVEYGQSVKKGDVLGYMDNTGHSNGGHLHWEVRTPAGVCIDPAPYINADLPGMLKPLKVNGWWGKAVTKRAQRVFGTTIDGKVSRQKREYKSICPAAVNVWKWKKDPKAGSALIKAIQKWLKLDQDGWMGPRTIKRLQKKLKVTVTGELDKKTVKAFQTWLNKKI